MGKSNFLLRDEYEEWLAKNNIVGNSMNCYLMQDKDPETGLLYFDIIGSFILSNELVYAYTMLDEWRKQIENGQNAQNKVSYLNKYKVFIHSVAKKPFPNKKIISESMLAPIRKRFRKPELALLDGMDDLVNDIGEDRFIRLAVESSFFFNEAEALKRFNDIIKVITVNNEKDPLFKNEENTLPARKCTKSTNNTTVDGHVMHNGKIWYKDEYGNMISPIKEDGNGNAMVCQMINSIFGYNMNVNLDKKPFSNYIISHIWGRAIDPRYFTSLWNIVLVPAWANHLLDKPNPAPSTLAAKFKDTLMEICIKYNGLRESKYGWGKIQMTQPVSSGSKQSGTYTIQVIQPKGNAVIGKIMSETVTI